MLINSGHRLEEIKHYTRKQFELFVECSLISEKAFLKRMSSFIRAAVWAEKKDFENILENN